MKVAVTGAAGFVGHNLVELLCERGHEVVAVDRVVHRNSPAGVTWAEADILDPVAMRDALDGVEVVYHLVAKITLAQHDEVAWTVNTKGVRTVAEAALAAGVRRFVHCSSIHSYDQRQDVCGGRLDEDSPRSDDATLPVYDRSKWAGERELREVIDDGLDAVICNPTGVYGPADYGTAAGLSRVNGMLRDAARGRVPALVEGSFDFVDVRDVALGLTAAADKGRTGENYLLTGEHIRMVDAFRFAARVAGRRGPLFAFPLAAVKPILPIAERVGRWFDSDLVTEAAIAALDAAPTVDGGKAAREIGYAPRSTQETIRDLIAFFVSSGQLDR